MQSSLEVSKKPLKEWSPKVGVLLIGFYRSCLSIFFGGTCRFYPSCSCYAEQAFQQHGFWTATKLTVKRVLKCYPFGKFGYDPVPERKGQV